MALNGQHQAIRDSFTSDKDPLAEHCCVNSAKIGWVDVSLDADDHILQARKTADGYMSVAIISISMAAHPRHIILIQLFSDSVTVGPKNREICCFIFPISSSN